MAQPKLKVAKAWMAPGYWGRDPTTHIQALQTAERVLALNYDKVRAMGLPFRLWTRITDPVGDRVKQCSCWNDTAKQSDVPCYSCYGNRFMPGFLKFNYITTFYSSIDTDLTLTNIVPERTITPFRLTLAPNATVGHIVTPPYTVPRTVYGPWETRTDAYPRDPSNLITTEWSTDGGFNWQPIQLLGSSPQYNPRAGTDIMFRVTLYRPTLQQKAPLFEIVRARFPYVPPFRVMTAPTPGTPFYHQDDCWPGEILILKTWDQERFRREQSGNRTETEGQRYWTIPLNYFNQEIERETPKAALGKDHFLEESRGPEAGARYVATKHDYSRTFKIFTRQDFNLRRIIGDPNDRLSGEALMRVW
jgi:hypothetical protein